MIKNKLKINPKAQTQQYLFGRLSQHNHNWKTKEQDVWSARVSRANWYYLSVDDLWLSWTFESGEITSSATTSWKRHFSGIYPQCQMNWLYLFSLLEICQKECIQVWQKTISIKNITMESYLTKVDIAELIQNRVVLCVCFSVNH